MIIKNLASKIWGYLWNRSPVQAASPNVQQFPPADSSNETVTSQGQPIETFIDCQTVIGGLSRLETTETAFRDPLGQLIRTRNRAGLLIGCDHIVYQFQPVDEKNKQIRGRGKSYYRNLEPQSQREQNENSVFVNEENKHIRGIAGKCYCCSLELQALLDRGEISVFEADRLSYVCTDCAKMTTSGRLCCPKHYTPAADPDGNVCYLDPEQAETDSRKNMVKRILTGVALPFLSDEEPPSKTDC